MELGRNRPETFMRSKTDINDQLIYSTSSFFIRNKTGEALLFKAGKQPAFTEMQNNETLPLDFNSSPLPEAHENLLADETGSKGFFDGVASSDMQPSSDLLSNIQTDEDEDDSENVEETDQEQQMPHEHRVFQPQKPRSMYRRGKFTLKKSEPNIVLLQVLISQGKEITRTESFEINFNLLTCQRVFLDETRKLYVIC